LGVRGRRITSSSKSARLYLKNTIKVKGLGIWLKWYSTCPASMRPLSSICSTIKRKEKKKESRWRKQTMRKIKEGQKKGGKEGKERGREGGKADRNRVREKGKKDAFFLLMVVLG
jgi:hypothetical protein